MAAIKKNLLIECGTDAILIRFRIRDSTNNIIDITGCKARAQIRTDYNSSNALITFSTDDGSINMDTTDMVISVIVTPEHTNNISATKAVWDFEFVDTAGNVSRIFEGKVVFSPQVTRFENV